MKVHIWSILVVTVLTMTVSAQSLRDQLDKCQAERGDQEMNIRNLRSEANAAKGENASIKKERDEAVKQKDHAVKQAEDLKKRNVDLEKNNKELAATVEEMNSKSGNLEMLAAENNRLATENMNLRNTQPTPVAVAAPVEKFLYPVAGILNNKSVSNNVIIADFVFVNNGSRSINSFDSVLKFYVKERKIYEISLPNVRNHSGAATGRNESINFRAGLPITDQNLVNASVESIDLIVEVTRIQ